jgi:vacuolar-type H+-ATPase subunit F/Vma7
LSSVRAVLGEGLGAGFSLAGVDVEVVTEPGSAREAIMAACGSRECGILVTEEELFARLGERERDALLQRTIPLIVLLPGDMRWGEEAEIKADDYVAALIRRAVGYQLNIRM